MSVSFTKHKAEPWVCLLQDKNHNYIAGQLYFSYTFFNLSQRVC